MFLRVVKTHMQEEYVAETIHGSQIPSKKVNVDFCSKIVWEAIHFTSEASVMKEAVSVF